MGNSIPVSIVKTNLLLVIGRWFLVQAVLMTGDDGQLLHNRASELFSNPIGLL
jgi:hypothetical protein